MDLGEWQRTNAKLERILTRRQREILRLMVDGLALKEIAHRLGLTYQTVRNHMCNIYDRLNLVRPGAIGAIITAFILGELDEI